MTVVLATPASRIVVEASRAECAWLEAFLTPAFSMASRSGDGNPRVRLVSTPAPSTPVDTGIERVAFVLDRRPVRLTASPAPDATVYADPELQLNYSVRSGDAAVHRGGRDDLTRIALMRVVREYAHNALVDSGGLVIHAASWAGPRGAVLVTGVKGVGKTTLLARMLSQGGMSCLANDRVGITPDLRLALSIPTIVAVRSGTRRLLPELGERLRPLVRFTELEASSAGPPDRTTDSWYFAPRQFAAALSSGITASAPLAAIVALQPDVASGRLRRAAAGEAADLLVASLLGSQAGVFVSEIFRDARPAPQIARRLRAACLRLAGDVPCFTLPAPASLDVATLDALSALCQ